MRYYLYYGVGYGRYYLNQLNLNADIDKLMLEYENVLGAMEMTGAVTAES